MVLILILGIIVGLFLLSRITKVGTVNVSQLPSGPQPIRETTTVPIGRLPGFEEAKARASSFTLADLMRLGR